MRKMHVNCTKSASGFGSCIAKAKDQRAIKSNKI